MMPSGLGYCKNARSEPSGSLLILRPRISKVFSSFLNMFINLPTLILPLILLGGITAATPLEIRDLKVVEAPGVDVSKLPPPPTITVDTRSAVGEGESDAEKRTPLPAGALTTSPNSAFHALAGTAVDQFVMCPVTFCSGACYGILLSEFQPDICYTTSIQFMSFYIYQPSNTGLPYGFQVGLTACSHPVLVLMVNRCYNSDGIPFQSIYRT